MSDLQKLRNFLPAKYAKMLRDRIMEKYSQEFSRNYIVMVVQGKRQNNVIIQEAVILACEERDRRLLTAEKLESLTSQS